MSIEAINAHQSGPINSVAAQADARRTAAQVAEEAIKAPTTIKPATTDSFEPATPPPADAQKNAQLRRVAAQIQASQASQAPAQPLSPQSNSLIEPGLQAPLPYTPDAAPDDATPDPVPPSLAPETNPGDTTPLVNDSPDTKTAPTNTNEEAATELTDLQLLQNAFGRSKGQEGYAADLDLNSDGVINGVDLANLLARSGSSKAAPTKTPPSLTPSQLTAGILESFGQSVKTDGASSQYDLNADGVIDGRDLAQSIAKAHLEQGPIGDPVKPNASSTLETLLSSFGKKPGADSVSSGLDLNQDGVINGADLAQYLAQLREDA